MSDIQFPFNPSPFGGTLDAFVLDNNGNPANVLEAGKEFRVKVKVTLTAVTDAWLKGGEVTVTTYAESIGPGFEGPIGYVVITLTGASPYIGDIVVPANTLLNDPIKPDSGVYKLATVLTHKTCGHVDVGISALVEGPVIRVA